MLTSCPRLLAGPTTPSAREHPVAIMITTKQTPVDAVSVRQAPCVFLR